jgi:hypothetical protein
MGGRDSREGFAGEYLWTGVPVGDLLLDLGVEGGDCRGGVTGGSALGLEVTSIFTSPEGSFRDIQDGPYARTGLGETQRAVSGRGGRGGRGG